MTQYAGELIRVKSVLTDFDHATVLTDTDVADVTVEVFDADLAVVLPVTAMLYNTEDEFWYYLWDTTSVDAGTYKAKILVTGTDGKFNWEFKRIRLARNPV